MPSLFFSSLQSSFECQLFGSRLRDLYTPKKQASPEVQCVKSILNAGRRCCSVKCLRFGQYTREVSQAAHFMKAVHHEGCLSFVTVEIIVYSKKKNPLMSHKNKTNGEIYV